LCGAEEDIQVDIEIQMVDELDIESKDMRKDTNEARPIRITNLALRGRHIITDCY